VERSGHGTEFIIERCEAQGLATPQYKPDSAIFHTIIWRKTAESAVSQEASCQVAQSNGPVMAQSDFSQGGQAEGADMGGVVGGVMGGVENATSTIHEKVFDFISKREMSNAEIARELGWSRVYGGLARVIKNLLSDGIIEYTIPEKPRSRLQKYRLTEKGRQMLAQKGKHK
jgi:ATP-dependent DNA helicase RecG